MLFHACEGAVVFAHCVLSRQFSSSTRSRSCLRAGSWATRPKRYMLYVFLLLCPYRTAHHGGWRWAGRRSLYVVSSFAYQWTDEVACRRFECAPGNVSFVSPSMLLPVHCLCTQWSSPTNTLSRFAPTCRCPTQQEQGMEGESWGHPRGQSLGRRSALGWIGKRSRREER